MSVTSKNKAIKIKLANLIAATPKDVCIRTKINNFSFDLYKYFSIEELNSFINGDVEKINLSASKSKEVLEQELVSCNNVDRFLDCLKENEIFLAKTRIEKLNRNFEKYKDPTIQLIVSKSSGQKRKIDAIIKKNKVIADNTGIYSLYIASNFITGVTSQGTQINAPLVLYPIEIVYNNDSYKIKLINNFGNQFIVNEKLLSLLSNEYKANLSILDLVKESKKLRSVEPIIQFINKILKQDLNTNGLEYRPFIENVNYHSFTGFCLSCSFVCGIFEPTGGALKYDLERLIKLNVDPFNTTEEFSKTKFVNDELNSKSLISIDRPLNIYQKYAIRSALSQNTIIFGPPGTGKSEVIANIIANALNNKKSILVAAEKRVALDVLIERLGELSNFALYIGDLKDKADFYNKILEISDKLENIPTSSELLIKNLDNNKTSENSRSIEIRDELKKHFTVLQSLVSKTDSSGTDFNEYLNLLRKIDPAILNFVKKNNSLVHLNKMMYYYSFNSIDSFFEKMNQYRNFLMNYKISPEFISQLKEQKKVLMDYDIKYNFLLFLESYGSKINAFKKDFLQFLNNNSLINNKSFLNLIKNDVMLLKHQKIILNEIKATYGLFNKDLLLYLINQSSKIKTFVAKNSGQKNSLTFPQLVFNFLRSTKFSKYVDIKEELTDKDAMEYFEIFTKYCEMPENDNSYLMDLNNLKNDLAVDQNIILMYFNSWLSEPYIKELGLQHLTFFSNKDLVNFAAISNISNEEYQIIYKISKYEQEVIKGNRVLNIDLKPLINEYREAIAKEVEQSCSNIAQQYLISLKEKIAKLDEETKQKVKEVFSIAKRESKKNVPIKEFIATYHKELKIIFPIWISMPELIAQVLPLEQNIFDYGIFDEASQIFMERAYPIIYRCKIKIVAGDDKQLKPTSFFALRVDEELQNFEYSDNDQVDSLLDRAKVALWPSYHLRNHYRSIHRDLIQFSNDHIYNNNLQFVSKNGNVGTAIQTINVPGIHDEGVNILEAETVFNSLVENINKYQKIIVVTFGIKQSLYIEQLIYKNVNEHPAIYEKMLNGDLIVCSLENVQGNEGDLVILSVTYGKDSLGNFKANFGPIFMDGGMNRLNVATTRAKDKMIVVKSFNANEMVVNMNNVNARLFYQFITYCEGLGEKNSTSFVKIVENALPSIIHNDLRDQINKYLRDNNKYYLIEHYDIGSRVIDLAILDKNTNETKFAIVINRLSKDINVPKMFELMDQYYFLADRGYNTYLLDEYYWVYNREEAFKKLHSKLNKI